MRHTSTALYFYGASKKSLHKPRTTSGNILFHISYAFNYHLQLLCLQFLSKTHLIFKNCPLRPYAHRFRFDHPASHMKPYEIVFN
jgi:hypothetical protein